jgi:hypothetical protein
LEQSISHWVTDNGGLSFMIPSVSGRSTSTAGFAGSAPTEFIDPHDSARELDALILQGGTDVGIDPIRDRYELELLSAFHKLGKTVLVIFGLHVHVGMPDAQTMIKVMNAFIRRSGTKMTQDLLLPGQRFLNPLLPVATPSLSIPGMSTKICISEC